MTDVPLHSSAFRRRRFMNWFPLGLAYAMLYMGRYNLTVAKTSLGTLMTKEDFGIIFAAGTATYAISFLINGPLVDRIGGRKGMLIALTGAGTANLVMGLYLASLLSGEGAADKPLRLVFSLLYAVNMYFQSYAAVSIVKVNAHWFHIRERGGFSGIFGTMISSGIFFAFTGNGLILRLSQFIWPDSRTEWIVFVGPGALLLVMLGVAFVLLRDRPSGAGFDDFDTGDASSGDDDETPVPTLEIFKRILTNRIILIVAGVEFCTGVLRNGVMHWFPIYAKEVWVLPGSHPLRYGNLFDVLFAPLRAVACDPNAPTAGLCSRPPSESDWQWLFVSLAVFAVAGISAFLAKKASGTRRGYLTIFAGLAFLAPFFPQGWGGLLFVAGVIGGNVAGWVSDLFFQSRRAPAAGGLYGILALCVVGMIFALNQPSTHVSWAAEETGLLPGDRIQNIAGQDVTSWAEVANATACFVPTCIKSTWDEEKCMCTSAPTTTTHAPSTGTIPAIVIRGKDVVNVDVKDPAASQRAGEKRKLKARPVLPVSPWILGLLVFVMSLCVIGTHGLLSGTATMDFGGRKAAGTTVGVIDGFVYLGTALQSIALGELTGRDWSYWPLFLLPFAVLGFFLLTRIWHAQAGKGGH